LLLILFLFLFKLKYSFILNIINMKRKRTISDKELNILRLIIEKHMHIDSQLDSKANMILVLFGIVTIFSLSQLISLTPVISLNFLGWLIISTSSIASLVITLMGVFPKYMIKQKNIFYYASFIKDLSEDEFIKKMKEILSDRDSTFKAFARELYTMSLNVLKPGYRRVRLALAIFLSGMVIGSIMVIISIIFTFSI